MCRNEADMARAKTKQEDSSKSTLEEMFKDVEKQITCLENEDLSLEESFNCYKRGMELLKTCSDRIDRTEKQVLEIEQDGSLVPYSGEEDNVSI